MHEQAAERALTALGDRFGELYAEGGALSLEQAVEYALALPVSADQDHGYSSS